jgi:hypothetical protein
MAKLYARALGERLTTEERSAFNLEEDKTAKALTRPISGWWVAFTRWKLYQLLAAGYFKVSGFETEADRFRGWKVAMAGYRDLAAKPEAFRRPLDYVIACIELASGCAASRTHIADNEELTPEKSQALWDEAVEILVGLEKRVWRIYELVAAGTQEARNELGLRKQSILGTEGLLDQKRNLKTLARVIRDHGMRLREGAGDADPKRLQEALDLYQGTFDRLAKLKQEPPLSLRLDQARTYWELERREKAEELAKGVRDDAKKTLRSHDREQAQFERTLYFLVEIRLAHKDPEGARAYYEEARTSVEALEEEGWTELVEQLKRLEELENE